MFTGLIKSVGKLVLQSERLAVECDGKFLSLELGDSVSVDGVCLTVADFYNDGFLADVSGETLSRSTLLIKAKRRGLVNLEPALRLSDRLGGHLVSGHVDGLGEVIRIEESKNSWYLEVRWQNPSFGRYVCEKASIALDGISLTVAGCSKKENRFWIAVIPHTWSITSLQYLVVGSLVNLEADLMAKYLESIMGSKDSTLSGSSVTFSEDITTEWLSSHGWS